MTGRERRRLLGLVAARALPYRPAPSVPIADAAPAAPLPGIRAVLFDVYGTLVVPAEIDDGQALRERLNPFLSAIRCGLEPEALAQALRVSIDAKNRAAAAAGVSHPEMNILEVWREVLGRRGPGELMAIALEYEMIVHPCRPVCDLAALFTRLRERGLELGIISNAQFYTPLLLEHYAGRPLEKIGFDKNLLLYSYGMRIAKPADEPFRRAAAVVARRGITPGSVLFVGDSPENDIRPARRAGFRTALCPGREAPPDDLRPDVIVTDWHRFDALLE